MSILPLVTARAKLFQNGGSQAVRLPKSCRFPGNQQEVVVHREGRRVVLEAPDEWPAEFVRCLGAWPEEIERPKAHRLRALKDPF
ncbi:MAG: antidote-toxin recognition MazE [Polyangiaceae bacterium]|nr:antidote-toxin recognition MazE [Polyangiaceae bacterium]